TLDPDTAHPRLLLSGDGKRVRWDGTPRIIPDHPKRFDSSRCVLGLQGFTSGRHYWEVQVAPGATTWALGVAKDPAVGIWAVGLCGGLCQALASPSAVPLALRRPPGLVGVFLDYEGGLVAFLDGEVPVFSYPGAVFGGEKVLP
ncbi:BT1A1 protein, partial [Pachyramphus minor]|nr:BT1A1 protein [Pachyramphus minor]